MKLVSACLLGVRCSWNSDHNRCDAAIRLSRKEVLLPVCPEQLGGLPTPRVPQEIKGGSGDDVLSGRCRVLNKDGIDVTDALKRGAEETLRIALAMGATAFVGRSRSPSCGVGGVYNGSFSGRVVPGDGITAALLRRNGIQLIPEDDLQALTQTADRQVPAK
jgi:uncharacterized protein YbbK (DUF523 family)